MYSYLKLARCRICQFRDDKIISEMDKDLLNEMPTLEVQAKYSGHFTDKSNPLTAPSIYSHRKHLMRAVPSALLEIPDLSKGTQGSTELTSPVRSEGFNDFLGTIAKNKEMLDNLVSSAMEDLNSSDEILESAFGPKNKAIILSIRDRIRQSLAEYIELSKTLSMPQIAVNIGGNEGDRVAELLVLVRQAFEKTIPDDNLRQSFFNELAVLIRRSTTLKDIFENEKK